MKECGYSSVIMGKGMPGFENPFYWQILLTRSEEN